MPDPNSTVWVLDDDPAVPQQSDAQNERAFTSQPRSNGRPAQAGN
jgi:hypothetical protein